MKKSTYDAISTIAVVALVVFTIGAQHSSRFGYVFGVLAMLTAAGLFGAYIKGLRAGASTDQRTQAIEPAKQSDVAQLEALERELLIAKRHQTTLAHEAAHMRLRAYWHLAYTVKAIEQDRPSVKVGTYYTRVRFHHAPVQDDPASIIANIVEKLCGSSKEPRFEFILEPDGRFKIQQVPAKRAAVVEPTVPQEEPVEPPAESEKPQLVN